MKKKNNSEQHGLRLSVVSFILCFFIVLSVTACSDNKISSEETKSGESVSPSAQTDVGSAVKLRETEILDNFYGLLNGYKDCLVNKSSYADLFSRYFHQEGTSLFASMAEYEARRAAFEGENILSFAYSIEEYNMDHSDKSVHLTAMLDYETVYAGLLPDMTYVWEDIEFSILYENKLDTWKITALECTYPLYMEFCGITGDINSEVTKRLEILQNIKDRNITFGQNLNEPNLLIYGSTEDDYEDMVADGFDYKTHVPAGVPKEAAPGRGAYLIAGYHRYKDLVFYYTDMFGYMYSRTLYGYDLKTGKDRRLIDGESTADIIFADNKAYGIGFDFTDGAISNRALWEIDPDTLESKVLFTLEVQDGLRYLDKVGDYFYFVSAGADIWQISMVTGEAVIFASLNDEPGVFLFPYNNDIFESLYVNETLYTKVTSMDGYRKGVIVKDCKDIYNSIKNNN